MPPPRDWKPNPQKIWDEAENSNGKGKGKQLDADEVSTILLPIRFFDLILSSLVAW